MSKPNAIEEHGAQSKAHLLQDEDDLDVFALAGLVRQYGICMERGGETLETKKFPLEVYLILEKGVSLFDYQWGEPGLGKSDRKSRLYRDLLQGLVTIH